MKWRWKTGAVVTAVAVAVAVAIASVAVMLARATGSARNSTDNPLVRDKVLEMLFCVPGMDCGAMNSAPSFGTATQLEMLLGNEQWRWRDKRVSLVASLQRNRSNIGFYSYRRFNPVAANSTCLS